MTGDDLKMVKAVVLDVRRHAQIVRGYYRAKTNPQPVPWNWAEDLAEATDDAVYWMSQLIREVERLQEFERLWKELEHATTPS